jgi:hypothetical protein
VSLNTDTLSRLEEAFATGASDMEACVYASLSQKEFTNHIQSDPTFAARRGVLKQRPLLLARQTVMKAPKEDPKFALEFLDREAGTRSR